MIKNAVIKSADILFQRGHLTINLQMDYGGAVQGFGGYGLDDSNNAALFLRKVMELLEVSEWSRVVGKSVRVDGNLVQIERIGHLLKDKWFDPGEELGGE